MRYILPAAVTESPEITYRALRPGDDPVACVRVPAQMQPDETRPGAWMPHVEGAIYVCAPEVAVFVQIEPGRWWDAPASLTDKAVRAMAPQLVGEDEYKRSSAKAAATAVPEVPKPTNQPPAAKPTGK